MSLFCGPCLFADLSESQMILDTAMALQDIGVEYFRCKLWGGGTRPDRYFPGVGIDGFPTLEKIMCTGLKCGTEVQATSQVSICNEFTEYIWIGARNSSNYTLRSAIRCFEKPWALKRAANMSIENLIGAHDIDNPTWIIERGVDMLYQPEGAPFGPDLKGVLRIKNARPDIFDKLIVDCSHSVFMKPLVGDVYRAFKAVGVKHFMFECTIDGKSKTDQAHMLSVIELENILKGE